MNKHQTMARVEAVLLALAECPNCQARQDIEQARDLVRQAQRVLDAFDVELRALGQQALLADFETGRLALQAAAAADPENRQTHMAKAARIAKAYAILSAPRGA